MRFSIRAISSVLVAAILIAGFSGCKKYDKLGETQIKHSAQTLVCVLNESPTSLDPHMENSFDTAKVVDHLFEGLYRIKQLKAEPAMAESAELSGDGLTFTVKLRDSKWSDGKPVRAQDFEFAFKRAVNPNIDNPSLSSFDVFKNGKAVIERKCDPNELGVTALDDRTLQIQFEKCVSNVEELLSGHTFVPLRADLVNNDGTWINSPSTSACNGPFKLSEYTINSEVVMKKNPYYYAANTVKLDKLVLKVFKNFDSGYAAYKQDIINVMTDVPENVAREVLNSGEYHAEPSIDTQTIIFNFSNPVLKDKKVRLALSMAIDREKLTMDVLGGLGEKPAVAFLPAGLLNSKGEEIRIVAGNYGRSLSDGDFKKARVLLAEAGYPEGKGFPNVEIWSNHNPTNANLLSYLQEQWKQNLGITVEVRNHEWGSYVAALNEGTYPGMCRQRNAPSYPDPIELLGCFKDNPYCKNPQSQYGSREYNELYQKIKFSVGEERDKDVLAADKLLVDDAACIPLYYGVNTVLAKSNIKGLHMNCLGYIYFGDAYFEN